MTAPKADWRIVVVAVVGSLYGIDSAFENFTLGMISRGLSGLSLICLFSPLLMLSRGRWLFRAAAGFCLFQALGSGLVFLGSLFSPMNPLSFTIRLFTVKVLYLGDLGSQFLYFACRGGAFFAAFILLVSRKEEQPNEAVQRTSATPPSLT